MKRARDPRKKIDPERRKTLQEEMDRGPVSPQPAPSPRVQESPEGSDGQLLHD